MKAEEHSNFLIPYDVLLRRKMLEEIWRGYFLLVRYQFHYAATLPGKKMPSSRNN